MRARFQTLFSIFAIFAVLVGLPSQSSAQQSDGILNDTNTGVIISLDMLVYHPSLYGYDIQAFLDKMPGSLSTLTVPFGGRDAAPSEIIEFYAYYYSINPQVFLTLLEVRSSLLTMPLPTSEDLQFAMGNRDAGTMGFEQQIAWVGQTLYGELYSQGNPVSSAVDDTISDEIASQALLTAMLAQDTSSAQHMGGEFVATFERLFGTTPKFQRPTPRHVTVEPEWKLPWEYNHTWYFWAGPHVDGWGGRADRNDYGALDFVPRGGSGCFYSSERIAAMAGGTIIYASRNLTQIKHNDEWSTIYYHVVDQVPASANPINPGTAIGRPSCETGTGGSSTNTHVHVSHVLNGVVQSSVGWRISGWQVQSTTSSRIGTMTRDGVTKYSRYGHSKSLSESELVSDNATDSDGGDISIGQNRNGTINPAGDEDDFYFSGTAGQTVTIRVNSTGNGLDPMVALYRPNGTLLGENDDERPGVQNSLLVANIDAGGRYKIKVRGYPSVSGRTGNYNVDLQASSGDTDDRRWIAQGQTLNGSISPSSDRDTYYFTGGAGTVVSIRMNQVDTSLDSYLELYSSGGSLIALNDDGGGGRNSWLVKELPTNGTYVLVARSWNSRSAGRYTLSYATTYTQSNNLALRKGTNASSIESAGLEPYRAVDGDRGTRWSSRFSDNQYIYVDLGAVRTFNKVVLRWENAYARIYGVFAWRNNRWEQLYATGSGDGNIDTITFSPTSARFVLMYGDRRGTPWGFSLYEFEVYNTAQMLIPLVPPGDAGKDPDDLLPLAPLAPVEEGKDLMLFADNELAQENAPLLDASAVTDAPADADVADLGTPYAEIVEPSEAALESVVETGMLQFEGYAVDNDEDGASIEAYEWQSDVDGTIGAAESFSLPVNSLSEGDHVFSFRAQDNEGMWSEVVTRTVTIQHVQYLFLPSIER